MSKHGGLFWGFFRHESRCASFRTCKQKRFIGHVHPLVLSQLWYQKANGNLRTNQFLSVIVRDCIFCVFTMFKGASHQGSTEGVLPDSLWPWRRGYPGTISYHPHDFVIIPIRNVSFVFYIVISLEFCNTICPCVTSMVIKSRRIYSGSLITYSGNKFV